MVSSMPMLARPRWFETASDPKEATVVRALNRTARGVLVAASRFRPSPALAALLLACASGVCFAMTAMFMKLTGDDLLGPGIAATARDWVGYGLAASTGIGLALGQLSHAAGPLPWSVSAMNIVNPLASYAGGVIAFHAHLPTSPGALAGLAGAGALLVLGLFTRFAAFIASGMCAVAYFYVHAGRGSALERRRVGGALLLRVPLSRGGWRWAAWA